MKQRLKSGDRIIQEFKDYFQTTFKLFLTPLRGGLVFNQEAGIDRPSTAQELVTVLQPLRASLGAFGRITLFDLQQRTALGLIAGGKAEEALSLLQANRPHRLKDLEVGSIDSTDFRDQLMKPESFLDQLLVIQKRFRNS